MKSKAISYCRVSSREQEETGYSLDAQEKLLAEYALKEGLIIAKVFKITESASGRQIRKTLNEMLAYAEKNKISIVLCEKIDRLTRNLKDASIVDEWVRAESERAVHFIKEHFVLNANTKAHDNFIWDMKVAVARFYTNNLSEEVKKGQKEKLAQGWLPTSPPYGYTTVGEKGRKIHIIDEKTAPFMRRMFELYASGNYSLTALREKLYEEGFRSTQGGKLAKSRLDDLLRDPFYYGAMRWNDVLYEHGAHEPLISKELFNKVQEILSGRTTPHKSKKTFQFRKLLKCGECQGTITAEIQKGIVYYHCNHYRNCSQKKFTREDQLEEQLFGVFRFFENITAAEAAELKEKIKANHAQEVEYKEKQIKSFHDRYMALQRRLDNLYNDRLDERITTETWEKKQKEIVEEQSAIQDRLKALKSDEAKYFEIWLNIIDLACRAREIYQRRTPEQRRTLLKHLFSNLMLEDEKVGYTLTEPVEVLAKRVQERIDAEKDFRTKKTPANTRVSRASHSKISPLL